MKQAYSISFNENALINQANALKLTPQELRLLIAFYNNTGKILSKDMLLKDVWNCPCIIQTRTIDMHVQRLRKKLGKACIETIYGKGYRFVGASPCFA